MNRILENSVRAITAPTNVFRLLAEIKVQSIWNYRKGWVILERFVDLIEVSGNTFLKLVPSYLTTPFCVPIHKYPELSNNIPVMELCIFPLLALKFLIQHTWRANRLTVKIKNNGSIIIIKNFVFTTQKQNLLPVIVFRISA